MKTTSLLTFLLSVIAITAIYITFGSSGSFYYDDISPLSALTQVTDLDTALVYTFSNVSGPTGRPISMASFLLNLDDWPNNSPAFFHINILIHALNALLVFVCVLIATQLLLKSKNTDKENKRVFWVAALTSIFWYVLPIHTATTLIAIQRMTLLSSFFTLAGIASYLYLSFLIVKRVQNNKQSSPNNLVLVQFVSIIFFTLLATFSKESGALLPLYLLVLEVTLLRSVSQLKTFRKLRLTLLSGALIILVLMLLVRFFNGPDIEIGRQYSTLDRALSQPMILLTYLKMAFLPHVDAINPFHDNAKIYTSIFAWQVIVPLLVLGLALAWSILKRKSLTVLSFGILWFFTAHLLESTLIPLEPMFLHRNYLALIGPCYVLIFAITAVDKKQRASAAIGGGIYLTFLLSLTFYTVSLWGTPRMAADAWYKQQKGSERATGHYVQELLKNNEASTSLLVIKEHLKDCENCLDSELKAVALACLNNDQVMAGKYLQRSMDTIKAGKFAPVAPVALPLLFDQAQKQTCKPVTMQALQQINSKIVKHTKLKNEYQRTLNENLYNIARHMGDAELAYQYLSAAWKVSHSHKVAEAYINVMIEQGKLDRALHFASNEMCANLPNRPFLKKGAMTRCKEQKVRIEQLLQ